MLNVKREWRFFHFSRFIFQILFVKYYLRAVDFLGLKELNRSIKFKNCFRLFSSLFVSVSSIVLEEVLLLYSPPKAINLSKSPSASEACLASSGDLPFARVCRAIPKIVFRSS